MWASQRRGKTAGRRDAVNVMVGIPETPEISEQIIYYPQPPKMAKKGGEGRMRPFLN